MKDLMIDLETLGTGKDALITQIGACEFNRETGELGEMFLMNIDIQSSLNCGFKVTGETIHWWLERPEQVTWTDNTDSVVSVLNHFKKFCNKLEFKRVWSHATFDFVILNNAYELCGWKSPLRYRSARDIRTLVDLAGIKNENREGKTHNALDDCKYQVGYCTECFRVLKERTNSKTL